MTKLCVGWNYKIDNDIKNNYFYINIDKMISEINDETIVELKLELCQDFTTEEFVQEIICIDNGKKAVIMNTYKRKIFITNGESGISQEVSLGHHSKNFTNKEFDDNQIGTLFLYKKGFGVLYSDMIFLFENSDSIEYKVIPIPIPVARVMMPGFPKPNNQVKAYYKEDTNQVYVLFDEMQARNSKTFFAVIKLSDEKAEYEFWPKHFKFPKEHIEANSLAGDDVKNNPILVNFMLYKNQFCIASYGRAYNMAFGKTPSLIYFSTLDEMYNGKEILNELKCKFTNGVITSDLKFLSWEQSEKAKKDIVFYSLENNLFYKINLKSKKNNFNRFNIKNSSKHNLSNNYYWHSDGTEKVSCYKIVKGF